MTASQNQVSLPPEHRGMRTEAIDKNLLATVAKWAPPRESGREVLGALTAESLLRLFDSQLTSRHIDLAARHMSQRGEAFFTIGSSGHEGNAVVAATLRATDPALLHYRSQAFYVERAKQAAHHDSIRDIMMGITCASEEPMSGGRHKVIGRRELSIIPTTSTIASHLPRAIGIARFLEQQQSDCLWPTDAIVICSFGNSSADHSTAQGAFNAASQASYTGVPMPVLFVCEDNGIGISVSTPVGWIGERYRGGQMRYFAGDACDAVDVFRAASAAAHHVREQRSPAFLHLRTVRLMGHAGSDVESAYRSPEAIAADMARDPVVRTAALLVDAGVLEPRDVLDLYEQKRKEVGTISADVAQLPRVAGRTEVMRPIYHSSPVDVRSRATLPPSASMRRRAFGSSLPEEEAGLTLAQAINRSLREVLAMFPNAIVFGEDVAKKGGVYGVTRGLQKSFGPDRVLDTLLDEQTILGWALGAGLLGMLPIPEIQYLAYLHNAADQIRGEAATMSFFSAGQYRNPMVVRIAGYGYQKGFGGHFHNDNSIAALRDIPGIIIASPSRPDDAASMLRTCAAAAMVDGRVVVFLEPIALYHTRDLHEAGDGGWLAPYPTPKDWSATFSDVGRARCHGNGKDLTIITFGNGLPMSLRAARELKDENIGVRVLDMRWLAPLPKEEIVQHANATGRVLVVDETRQTGGVSEAVLAALADGRFNGTARRVASSDSLIPLGPAANDVLLSDAEVLEAARAVAAEKVRGPGPAGHSSKRVVEH